MLSCDGSTQEYRKTNLGNNGEATLLCANTSVLINTFRIIGIFQDSSLTQTFSLIKGLLPAIPHKAETELSYLYHFILNGVDET